MEIAKRTFQRKSPAKFADRIELPPGWFVLRHDNLPEKIDRRTTHGRWAAISSGSFKIYRIVRYSVNLPKDEIVLDWAGWIDLQGRIADLEDEIDLVIRTPRWWELPAIPFFHVDPGYRMSAWLAGLSLILALLSVALSVGWGKLIGGLFGGLVSITDNLIITYQSII